MTGTETILLVEDEDMVRDFAQQVLEISGYNVISARNGVEALKLCAERDHKLDLLVTDVVMPEMGGLELVLNLQKKLPDLVTLFASGNTDVESLREDVGGSTFDFIQKPYSPESLTTKIREILDRT